MTTVNRDAAVTTTIRRRTASHCCACNVVCHHIGPPLLCEAHRKTFETVHPYTPVQRDHGSAT